MVYSQESREAAGPATVHPRGFGLAANYRTKRYNKTQAGIQPKGLSVKSLLMHHSRQTRVSCWNRQRHDPAKGGQSADMVAVELSNRAARGFDVSLSLDGGRKMFIKISMRR